MSTYNSPTTTPNFDNLLLQSLMTRLQLRPPPPAPSPSPLLSQSFEEFLLNTDFDNFDNNSNSDNDDEENFPNTAKTQLSKEEAKLEKDIIKTILSGATHTLKPNSGQAVSIGDHHVCVGFHEESGSDYRVWEWHGHVMLFDEDDGYTPEYIYGNYFERLVAGAAAAAAKGKEKAKEKAAKEEEEEEESGKGENLGLRELIEGGEEESGCRVLHQSRNAGSTRVLE